MMSEKFRQNPRTAGRLIDGQAFVLTPDDNKLHTLNRAGSHIWMLAEGGCTVEQMAEALVERFDVDRDRALGDARSFCDDLVRRGILEPASS